MIAYRLYEQYGITTNQNWFEQNVKTALDDQYCEDLSDRTFSFMKMNSKTDWLITEHNWSKLNNGIVSLQDYMELYDAVQKNMDIPESAYRK